MDCGRGNFGGCKNKTQAVGSYPSGVSGFGVHDLAGNVAEWIGDFHQTYTAGTHADPQNKSDGSVVMSRGGGFYFSAGECRTYWRNPAPKSSTTAQANRGFRCCRSVDGGG